MLSLAGRQRIGPRRSQRPSRRSASDAAGFCPSTASRGAGGRNVGADRREDFVAAGARAFTRWPAEYHRGVKLLGAKSRPCDTEAVSSICMSGRSAGESHAAAPSASRRSGICASAPAGGGPRSSQRPCASASSCAPCGVSAARPAAEQRITRALLQPENLPADRPLRQVQPRAAWVKLRRCATTTKVFNTSSDGRDIGIAGLD